MNILVFSDSHGSYERIKKVTNSFLNNNTINYIIHLGDLVRDAENLKSDFESPSLKIEYVYGNCDFSLNRDDYEKELVICEKRFFILHGHTRYVKSSLEMLKSLSEQRKYDVVLYGHTHISQETYHNSTYIINPGSIKESRNGNNPSYAVINISDNKIKVDIRRYNL